MVTDCTGVTGMKGWRWLMLVPAIVLLVLFIYHPVEVIWFIGAVLLLLTAYKIAFKPDPPTGIGIPDDRLRAARKKFLRKTNRSR